MIFSDFTFDNFLKKYPRYRNKFGNSSSIQDIYQFLSFPLSIDKMINANELGMPALSGIVKELEVKFNNRTDINFKVPEIKQLIGCMVQAILQEFGFKSKIQRTIKNSDFFRSASFYEYDKKKQKYEIVSEPIIKMVK